MLGHFPIQLAGGVGLFCITDFERLIVLELFLISCFFFKIFFSFLRKKVLGKESNCEETLVMAGVRSCQVSAVHSDIPMNESHSEKGQ